MHKTTEEQTGSNTKVAPTYFSKRMQKLHGNGEFSMYVLSRITKTVKTNIQSNKEGYTIAWGKEQQDAFEEIKCRLIQLPVLHLPNTTGRFHLYSDTSIFATGSTLYQIQNAKFKLIAYTSKRLPETAKNFTELEFCGLAINIARFSHILKKS